MIERKTTEELLDESIHELAKHKPMDRITVKEIVENCRVTPATFYNHFRDKYDLIAWSFNGQMEKVCREYAEGKWSWKETIDSLVRVLYEDQAFFRNAFANTSGQNSFFASTHLYSQDLLKAILVEKAGENLTEELLFYGEFYLRGMAITMKEWIQDNCRFPAEQMAERLYKVCPAALQAYLR